MKILQLNDTHEGISNGRGNGIRSLLRKSQKEDFDLIVHCGDYCGAFIGHKTLRSTVHKIREFYPDKPYVSVIGNHDYRMGNNNRINLHPSYEQFFENYAKIIEVFKENDVHFLDIEGPYRIKGYTVLGHTLWFHNTNAIENINCFNYLPYMVEGDTNLWMQKRSRDQLKASIDKLKAEDNKIVFVSHFPVIKAVYEMDGDPFIGQVMQELYGCQYFLNGHAHQFHEGPLRYESGTTYKHLKYQIINIAY